MRVGMGVRLRAMNQEDRAMVLIPESNHNHPQMLPLNLDTTNRDLQDMAKELITLKTILQAQLKTSRSTLSTPEAVPLPPTTIAA